MTRKKLFTITTVLLMLFISFSCEKIKDEINKAAAFDVNTSLEDHYFSVDSLDFKSLKSVNEWQTLTEFEGSVNVDSIFTANGLSTASIEEGEFTLVTVSLLDPLPGMNLNFTDEMHVTIANSSSEAGTIVATTGTIPANSTSVTFTVNETNIAPFINNTDFYIKLEANVIGPIPGFTIPMVLESDITFTVIPL